MVKQAYIQAISVYLPEKIEKNDISDRFVAKLGIEDRHIADMEDTASDYGMKAVDALFESYGVDREEIDFLILCTQQPEYLMPTTACILHDKLGLKNSCGALDYNLGCSGYAYGLALVKGLIETGLAANVLLVTACLYTKYINKEDKPTRPLFGDGATATLISAVESERPGLYAFDFGTDGSKFDSLIIPVGADKYPGSTTPVVEEVDSRGNKRTNHEVFMDGQEIMHFTLREVPPMVERVLERAAMCREDIDYYVFHQANQFMLRYVQKKCKLEGMPFFNNCEKEGNTVSGTIPLGLYHILESHNPANLKRVMLAGFGVGLSWSGCIIDLSKILSKK